MLLPRFALHRPATLAEAVDLLARHGEAATVYAGGTELLLAMKHRIVRYEHLVDVKRIPGLAGVAEDRTGGLVIGALTTHHALERDPLIRRHLPAYAALSRAVANVRVRIAGTLGGNLCFAEPHADPPALLAALGARVELVGPGRTREVPVAEFVVGAFDTLRQPDEVLTRIAVPPAGATRAVAYARFAHLERPAIGMAAALALGDGGRAIARAEVWVGAVGPRPARLDALADALAGVAVEAVGDVLPEAADRAAAGATVDGDVHGSEDYKRHLVRVFAERAVRQALPAGPGRQAVPRGPGTGARPGGGERRTA
jgi:carbon-monoxide dehydrogenase medium subunit